MTKQEIVKAIKAINNDIILLDMIKEPEIVTRKRSTEELQKEFVRIVFKIEENDLTDDMPEEAFNFFNDNLDELEPVAQELVNEEKEAKKETFSVEDIDIIEDTNLANSEPNWMKGCEVCNISLINQMKDIISKQDKKDLSKAAEQLEEEQKKCFGEDKILYSKNAILQRYRYYCGSSGSKTSKTSSQSIAMNTYRGLLRKMNNCKTNLKKANYNIENKEKLFEIMAEVRDTAEWFIQEIDKHYEGQDSK